ncbi:hypothetical protein AZH43_16170 [Acinetobacter pragensis]|uniref:Uncharacterized protein n=1 Tax=Acinetobacter pragensis TaxID=1806892 RepID=A0A151XYU8_9GAMM|nr:hypothetical protein AZH43_16170 [Acinetobacter pragensis]
MLTHLLKKRFGAFLLSKFHASTLVRFKNTFEFSNEKNILALHLNKKIESTFYLNNSLRKAAS